MIIYNTEIEATQGFGQDYDRFTIEVEAEMPLTRVGLKVQVIRRIPRQYVSFRGFSILKQEIVEAL